MSKKPVRKEIRFLNRLLKGDVISRKQAMVQSRLGNPSATVDRLIKAGFKINRSYEVVRCRTETKTYRAQVVKYSI